TILARLITLTAMEIVLGIDNIVFISVVVQRLPEPLATRARRIGLGLALGFRVLFIFTLFWLTHLTAPIFTIFDHPVAWRDLVLFGGGLFILVTATREIHHDVEGNGREAGPGEQAAASFGSIIGQIALIDVVFSVDSIIT